MTTRNTAISKRRSSTLLSRWHPRLGSVVDGSRTRFHVWAPEARAVDVVVARAEGGRDVPGRAYSMSRASDGTFSAELPVGPGTRYWYRLDGDRLLPDPASRFQPGGVHGPSQVVDPTAFRWSDREWRGLREEDLSIYELHVGAFTPEGTFASVEAQLPYLSSLGVAAIEFMPLAEFAGRWNWGYDGVDLFAPSHRYGTPDDLRRLVDTAHRVGLGVIVDVVYNHLGPDGAYVSAFSPYYFTDRHKSPWGDGVNFDGPQSDHVRGFFIENALHWIDEYHVDGLRLDATHALQDDGERHFLAELATRVREEAGERGVVLIAEDERNLDQLIRGEEESGFGLNAVWSDDFHHEMRRLLAGDCEGYFRRFAGTTADLAETIRRGWFWAGQPAADGGEPRGSDPTGIPLQRFVFCLQNHDQVGNRAFGERLNHQVELAAFRAASAVLLCAPETPLIFMGQEWAASSPFLYFTDHEAELGSKVTEGRRSEFSAFSAFADPATRDRIPDPQAAETFERSRLPWKEREAMPHAGVWRLYRALLRLRRTNAALVARADITSAPTGPGRAAVAAVAMDEETIAVSRTAAEQAIVLVARLKGAGRVVIGEVMKPDASWEVVLTTEDPSFAEDGRVPRIEKSAGRVTIDFAGPAAVLLRRGQA